MVCQRCLKAESAVRINKIINGKKFRLDCCEECAVFMTEVDLDTIFSSDNFIESVLGSVTNSALKVSYIVVTTCSNCGMTYRKFKEIGRLGCPDCFASFEEKLEPLIKNVHGDLIHTGKSPNPNSPSSPYKELKRLKIELQKAVDLEMYEEAVTVRDIIREMEREVGYGE